MSLYKFRWVTIFFIDDTALSIVTHSNLFDCTVFSLLRRHCEELQPQAALIPTDLLCNSVDNAAIKWEQRLLADYAERERWKALVEGLIYLCFISLLIRTAHMKLYSGRFPRRGIGRGYISLCRGCPSSEWRVYSPKKATPFNHYYLLTTHY